MPNYASINSRIASIKNYAWTNNYDSILVRFPLSMVGNDSDQLREFAQNILGHAVDDYRYLNFMVPGPFDDCVDLIVPVIAGYVYTNTLPGALHI